MDIVVTHNYAPTASFKTMVDCQGNVTKALYRRLERSEEEGTRCPTTFDLFKLFTSKYKQIPKHVEDDKKNALTITNRYHRFLFDDCDATEEMRERAKGKGDIIITSYNEEKWDAPKVFGIKKLFCFIGTVEGDEAKLHSREHSCFCQNCIEGDFKDCLYVETSGQLKEEVVKKLPVKEKVLKNNFSDEYLKLEFFKGNVPQLPVLIAIPKTEYESNEDPFTIGIMTKKVRQLCNEITHETLIAGMKVRKIIKKGTWCITVKFLHKVNDVEGEYCIPVKIKEIKVPMSDVYFPGKDTDCDRETYIKCAVRTIVQDTGQTMNIYTPEIGCMNRIKSAISPDN